MGYDKHFLEKKVSIVLNKNVYKKYFLNIFLKFILTHLDVLNPKLKTKKFSDQGKYFISTEYCDIVSVSFAMQWEVL